MTSTGAAKELSLWLPPLSDLRIYIRFGPRAQEDIDLHCLGRDLRCADAIHCTRWREYPHCALAVWFAVFSSHPLFPWRRLCAASFAAATLSAEWDERHRESTHDKQTIAHVKVYPGADGDFTLYSDDGFTYAYEKGDFQLTHIHWDDAAHKLSLTGTKAWSNDAVVDIVRAK